MKVAQWQVTQTCRLDIIILCITKQLLLNYHPLFARLEDLSIISTSTTKMVSKLFLHLRKPHSRILLLQVFVIIPTILLIGCVYIHNDDNFILESQMVDLTIFENRFQENFGSYVLTLGLSHYNYLNTQKLLMRFNWVQRNVIKEPWLGLNPRSRVAAPVVISSTNVK